MSSIGASALPACQRANSLSRGPAKGYIEGLEHRLHEAETLLLHLLPVVTPAQLETAAANLSPSHPNSNRDSPSDAQNRSFSPPILNKKTGVEYWENFPLDTAENILRWQQDCALHGQFRDDLNSGSRHGSRPNSVDLSRDPMISPSRKQSHVPHFRSSMSHESFVPTSQAEYMNPPTTSQQQIYHGAPNGAYMSSGYPSAAWQHQQHQQQQQQQHHHQDHHNIGGMHHQPHAQQVPIAAGGPMDVDGGFFGGEVKRNLFW